MADLIHDYLIQHAQAQPDELAIRFLDETLSYSALLNRSAQLALGLIEEGVMPGDRVGIYQSKSIHTAVAIYGVLLAGAVYVPLDPVAPTSRTATIIRNCDIACLVSFGSGTKRALRKLAAESIPLRAIFGTDAALDLPFKTVSDQQLAALHISDESVSAFPQRKADDLAYIIFTSGSTGIPKGIMHTHTSCLSYVNWTVREYGFSRSDVFSNHAPLHFDLSILDFFSAIRVGACTVIVPEEYTRLPASYTQLLDDANVSVLFTVPFAMIQMNSHGALEQRDLKNLRWAIFGGESFPPAKLRDLMHKLPQVKFDNMYGPAEVNGCTHFTVTEVPDDGQSVPVGRIADIAIAHIVDEQDQLVEPGEAGELLISTPTMMQGYWRQDHLNDQIFVQRICDDGHQRRFFRTGDLLSECVDGYSDGTMRFIGRKDRQVKIRGYRVELDEIELALTELSYVEEAVVFAISAEDSSQYLHAEVTCTVSTLSSEILRDLKQALPWYAIPGKLLVRDSFPRGATGKIDRPLLKLQASER